MAMAACSLFSYGQLSATWEIGARHAGLRAADSDDVVIILDDDLPEGGVMRTYLSDFNFASITDYGVTWAHDDKLATYIYWTDTDVAYVRNLSTYGDAWVQAYVDGESLWVPNGANIMLSSNGQLYQLITAVVNMKTNTMEARTGIKFTMNADRSELQMEPSPDNNNVLGFYTMCLESGSILQGYSKIKLMELTDKPVTPPGNAELKRYHYSALLGGWRDWENGSWMAFDGQDVYVQGLEWLFPDGWVKGAIMSDGSIRIPTGQYLGINGNYPVYYFAGIFEGDFADETATVTDRSAFFLNYDAQTGVYAMEENGCFISGKDKSWGFPVINGMFTPFDAKPGIPEPACDLEWDSEKGLFIFHIPMTDTDGNELDSYMLSYSVYVNGEKYTFTSDNSPLYYEIIDEMSAKSSYYIYDVDTEYMFGWNPGNIYAVTVKSDEPIKSLGVELYYDVLGDRRRSERAEIAVEAGLTTIEAGARQPVAFYSLDGRLLREPRGICIVKFSDGTVEKKILVK